MWRSMPDENRQVVSQGIVIQRNKIPDYRLEESLDDCIETWIVWDGRNLLPFTGTWLEQPAHIWDMLKAFDSVCAEHRKAEEELAALRAKTKRR